MRGRTSGAVLIVAALGTLAAPGCGASEDAAGEAVIDGQVAGRRFGPGYAIVRPGFPDPEGIAPGLIFQMLISESPHACTALRRNRLPRGSFLMQLSLYDDGRESLGAGAYTRSTAPIPWLNQSATSSLLHLDSSCKIRSSMGADPIVVTLDREARPADGVSGRFKATFGSDTVTGTFTAAPCDVPLPSSPSPFMAEPACGP
jgi:hypothetical protein